MRRHQVAAATGVAALALAATVAATTARPATGGTSVGAACTKPDAALKRIASGSSLGRGPGGAKPAPRSSVKLAASELRKIRSMHATAAMSMQLGGDDWTKAQVAGARAELKRMGVKLTAVTYAQGDASKQYSDLETLLTKKPDILLAFPLDPKGSAPLFKRFAAQGTKVVFLDLPAQGMRAGRNYVSVVSADNYGNGAAAAHLMAKALDCKGTVGIIRYIDPSSTAVYQRYLGFKQTIQRNYPDISIVEDQGINAPDFVGNAEKVASAMLTKHPSLSGIWGFFDLPAEGIIQAAESSGRSDLVVTTDDLGLNVAINMAEGKEVKGLGSQLPFDQGATEAMLGGYGLLGKKAPAYVALPPVPVDRRNVLSAWRRVYHAAPPAKLAEAARK